MSDGKSKAPGWVWIVVIVSVVVAALGILSALALFGVRKYMASAKQAEARAALVSWASGLTSCAQREGRLPGTSQPVPASLSDVQGKKWQSTPADWSEPAFSCAGFNMSGPQYFQYRWQLRGPDEGAASAVADLDGDGVPEKMLSVGVVCNAGACTAGSLSGADDAGRAYPENTSEAGKNPAPNPLFIAFVVVAVLGMLFGSIWMTVAGFQVSVGWGLVTLLVPCGRLVFLMQHWQVAKRPFIWQIGCVAALLLGGALYGGLEALLAPLPGDAPAVAPSVAPLPPSTPPALPPVVVPPLVGGAVDLSTVMGRARKLADAWQPEAALLGVEATLVDGKIQAQDGASAKVTFGPSAFGTAQARSGLFVVVYDKTGINGGPVAGTPGKTLPEPMCAPERVLTRLTFAAEGPTTLRYGLDGAQRPMWLANSQAHPKDQSLFDPQDCSPAGIVGRKQR